MVLSSLIDTLLWTVTLVAVDLSTNSVWSPQHRPCHIYYCYTVYYYYYYLNVTVSILVCLKITYKDYIT